MYSDQKNIVKIAACETQSTTCQFRSWKYRGHSKVQLEGITAIMAVCGIIAIEAAVFTGLSICAGCILSQRNNNDGKKKRKNKKRRKTK